MELYDLLARVIEVFENLHIPYLVTGSLAAMAYGEPRLTNDIDIVAGIDETHIPALLPAFPEEEFYLSEDALRDAVVRRDQFNIIHPSSGLKVDVIIRKDTAFDRSRFSRAHKIRPVETYEANFASPEDVIIKKMEYYREGGSEKHLRDIASMLRISGAEIDQRYIEEWVATLGLVPIWNAIEQRLRDPS
jgi:hypothetical protein